MTAEGTATGNVAQPMDISTYLFPNELRVTELPLTSMLLIGSCLSEDYINRFRVLDPGLKIKYLPFNNIHKLPQLDPAEVNSYQLMYVQIPIRGVLTDRIIRIFDVDRAQAFGDVLEKAKIHLKSMLEAAMSYNVRHGIPTLVANFFVPQGHVAPSLDTVDEEADLRTLISSLNYTLAQLVNGYKNAFIADVNGLANSYGKSYFLDDSIYFYSHGSAIDSPVELGTNWAQHENSPSWSAPEAGRIESVPDLAQLYPVRPAVFYRLVLDQIRYLYRIIRQVDQVKIVIFDLDNTLWRGQIAQHYEAGREWPGIGNWPVGLWEAVHHLRRRGIVVALCSKNDADVVRERWSRAVRLPWISLDDFVISKINWKPKSENVRLILTELGLTPRSAVFVDDNPVERSEVSRNIPGIRVLGGNPFLTRRILLWSAETWRSVMTNEAISREASYQGIVARNAEATSMDRDAFLRSLETQIDFHYITDTLSPLLPRVLELANKTTQFNTTGLQWTVADLTAFIENSGMVATFSVKDKYSDYGLVGAIFVDGSCIRQYVMSCRVLGMEVENTALKQILEVIRHRNGEVAITGMVIPTEVNTPCRDIFLHTGFLPTEEPGVFELS